MKDNAKLWVAADVKSEDGSVWELIGVFSTKRRAAAACTKWNHCCYSTRLNTRWPEKTTIGPDVFYPLGHTRPAQEHPRLPRGIIAYSAKRFGYITIDVQLEPHRLPPLRGEFYPLHIGDREGEDSPCRLRCLDFNWATRIVSFEVPDHLIEAIGISSHAWRNPWIGRG